MFKKILMAVLLMLLFIVPSIGMTSTVAAAEPENIALRRQAYASMYQNVPGIGSSSANSSWATSNTATTLPSYDETAMLVVDGIIGDTGNPLQYPVLQAMNINGTTTASDGVAAVTTSNLGNMIDGQSTTSGTATLSATAAAPISAANPLIIKATLPKPEKIVAYSLIQQPNTTGGLGSKPHAWKLQASKTGGIDAAEWVDIDSFTTAQNPGYGTLTLQRTTNYFNGRDLRYFDATGYNAFYSYNGSTPGTGNPRRSTTCNDYYQYYRLVITRTNQTSTTSNCAVTMCDFNLVAESPGGGLKNALRAPFISRWTSTASANQWLYIDLGEDVSYDKVKLHWGNDSYPTAYTIQVADEVTYNYGNGGGTGADAESRWRTVQTVSKSTPGVDEVSFATQTARFVRINMTARVSGSSNYKLYEFEVLGTRTAAPYKNPARPAPSADGKQELTGGDWTIARAEYMTETGEELSVAAFDDSGWIPAKVPGTALMSYVKAGIIPDTNFDMNLQQVSDTYFHSDWWYRTSFDIPANKAGQKVYVNFDGINWKAKVFVNGRALSSGFDIEGAYIRGKLDITPYANYGGKNYIAVHVIPMEHYGTPHSKAYTSCFDNGGLIGADNPTFHASINWDWIPTIRGRDTGIYDKVFVTYSGGVDLIDPWVVTEFDKLRNIGDNDLDSSITPSDDPTYDFSVAHTTLKAEVKNTKNEEVNAIVSGVYNPGNIPFSKAVTVPAGATVPVEIPVDIQNPNVWWPNTYGDQPLYTATVKVSVGGVDSDVNTFRFGVRKLVYTYTGSFSQTGNFSSTVAGDHAFNVYCNGVRIYCRGGNWGMDDSNVDLSYEDYRVRVKLHAEENFTMIRNWVGMTCKEAFWDACDEYGILVWDDFWLANPYDGPDPLDNEMFLKNAADKIRIVRKHASEALYCARNEGIVTRPLDLGIQQAIESLDGTRPYIRSSNSAVWGINGHGPYAERERKQYYNGNAAANFQLHTERGQHVIPNHEVLTKYFRPENMWPGFSAASTTAHPWRVNAIAANVWGVHDFFMGGNGPATDFFTQLTTYATMAQLNSRFNSLDDFCTVSQLPNYDLHRAMFEGFVEKKGSGLLMWMSMSAWPSFAWRTFDYFYDTSSAYFGIKKASEPLAIIWNPTNSAAVTSTSNSNTYNPYPGGIAVANNTGKVLNNLRAVAKIYSMDGELLKDVAEVNIAKLSVDQVLRISTATNANLWPTGSTRVKFLKLEVFDENGDLLTDNFYWRDTTGDTAASSTPSYTELQNLPKVNVIASVSADGSDAASNYYKVMAVNSSDSVAVQVRIKASDPISGEMILPTYFSDNYFCLLPGEAKVVDVEVEKLYFSGEPKFSVSGFNVIPADAGEASGLYTSMRFMMDGKETTQARPGAISLSATILAFEEIDTVIHPIIALYKNGALADVKFETQAVKLAAGGRIVLNTAAITIPALGNPGEYEVRGFLWDKDMIPIMSSAALAKWSPGELPNLALNRPALASSASGDQPIIWGNDGGLSTYWQTPGSATGNQWFTVDLGSDTNINIAVINLGPDSATGSRVDFATEANPDTFMSARNLTSVTAGASNTLTFEFGEVRARYVRVFKPGSDSSANMFSIRELEVYGFPLFDNEIRLMQPSDVYAFAGTPVSVSAAAYGYYGTGIVLSAENLPSGAAFDPTAGLFTWTPTYAPVSQVGTHSVTFKVDNGYTSDRKTFNIIVKYPNIALRKPVSASGQDDPSRGPENAVDGDFTSRWASANADNQWFVVDLGQEYTVSKLVFYWEAAYPATFRIDYATGNSVPAANSSSWIDATGTLNGSVTVRDPAYPSVAGVQTVTFSPVTARYIRFYGLTRTPVGGTRYGFSFFEMEVYEQ